MEQSALILRADGQLVDLINTIEQGKLVNAVTSKNYPYAPRSDLIRKVDGTIVSFTDTLTNALKNSSSGGGGVTSNNNIVSRWEELQW